MLLISEYKELRDNVLFSFNFGEKQARNWEACFPVFYDISSCRVFKCLTGKSVILSKATSGMFSKVILYLKMQIAVAVEWMLFEMAGGTYLNFRFLNASANWVIECLRTCATDRQWDSYSRVLLVPLKFYSPEKFFLLLHCCSSDFDLTPGAVSLSSYMPSHPEWSQCIKASL